MRNINRALTVIIILFAFITSISAHAADPVNNNHIIHVFVTNMTLERFEFTDIYNANPGNEFILSSTTLNPGETLTITAIKHLRTDVFGNLFFFTSTGKRIVLTILDQEQIHFGRPLFNMSGSGYQSKIISMVRNSNIGPRYLTYLEAKLQLLS